MKGLLIGESASKENVDLIGADPRRRAVGPPRHPPAHRAPRARRAARRDEAGVRPVADARGARRHHRHRGAGPARRRADRPPDLHRAGRLPADGAALAGERTIGERRHRRPRRDDVGPRAAPARRRSWRPTFAPIGILAMLLAVFVFSSSSTIVKWADTPGSVLAFWRMIGAVMLWWLVIGDPPGAVGPAGAVAGDVEERGPRRAVLRAQHHAVLHRARPHEHRPRRVHHRPQPARADPARRRAVQGEAGPPGAAVGAAHRARPGHRAVPRRQPGRGDDRRRRPRGRRRRARGSATC